MGALSCWEFSPNSEETLPLELLLIFEKKPMRARGRQRTDNPAFEPAPPWCSQMWDIPTFDP